MKRSLTTLGADAGLLVVAGIWGVNFSVMKWILEPLEPLALNALRFPLAGIVLAGFLGKDLWRHRPDRADILRLIVLGLLGHVAYQLCFVFGIDQTRAGNASLLLSTTPVWTMFFSAVAGHETPTRRVSGGVAATLLGMGLVVTGSQGGVSWGSETLRGDLLMVLGAVLWSIYTVAGRGPVARYGALRVTAWTLWVGAPVIVALGIPSLMETDVSRIRLDVWAGIAYAGGMSVGIAYVLWYRGVRALGNNRTAVYSNLVPVVALTTAWIWLGEKPSGVQFAGAGVILLGLPFLRSDQIPVFSSFRWRSPGNP
jgi:drug/metabolite transporter (DMT)-like permease